MPPPSNTRGSPRPSRAALLLAACLAPTPAPSRAAGDARLPTGLADLVADQGAFGTRNARAGSAIRHNPNASPRPASSRTTAWSTPRIPVCWESTTSSRRARQWVRDAVATTTWSAESRVRFVGWERCPRVFEGIRVAVADQAPHTRALGQGLSGRARGMVLNFAFARWGRACRGNRELCIKTIAVHQFGHALGLDHARGRGEADCPEPTAGSDPARSPSQADVRSVMNYANPKWRGDGRLSASDIEAVRLLYGWNRSTTFAGPGVGPVGHGAGAAAVNLDAGPIDLLTVANDGRGGTSALRYRVAFNLDVNGKPQRWGELLRGPGLGPDARGAGIAVADLDDSGRSDALFMAAGTTEGGGELRYKVAFDLDATGRPQRWSRTVRIEGLGSGAGGVGVDLADVDGDGAQDLVAVVHDQGHVRYRIGFAVDPRTAQAKWWSNVFVLRGSGPGDGASVVVDDFDADGTLEIVTAVYGQGRFSVRHHALSKRGRAGPRIRGRTLPGVGRAADGTGLAATDVDGDGWPDLILLAYDDSSGDSAFRYLTFRDVTEP